MTCGTNLNRRMFRFNGTYLAKQMQNDVLPPEAFPVLPVGTLEPLSRAYYKKRLLTAAAGSAFLLVVGSVPALLRWWGQPVPNWGLLAGWGMALGIAGLWLVVAHVGFKYQGYLVRQHDVTFQSGWLFRVRVTVPMARVQHSEIFRGPLDRWLGISTLRIYTAGSAGANLSIPGLEDQRAQSIRSILISHGAAH